MSTDWQRESKNEMRSNIAQIAHDIRQIRLALEAVVPDGPEPDEDDEPQEVS